MGRLTMTSDKGGVAFTFDLDITCRPSEAQKILKLAEKLKHYEDLEEQGRVVELDFNSYKRDDLDRCTHRHCNNCDKYRRELQHYKDLEEQDRLIEVVRCKDCHHRSRRWCEIWEGTTGENDFCSYGLTRAEIRKAEANIEAKLKELEG